MKRLILMMATVAACIQVQAQSTATDFTANDCAGESHHLFAELDAGQILVISFVMPCVGCISPSSDARMTVMEYGTSHPGRVNMYIADDEGDNDCSVLMSWRNANGFGLMTTFSTPLLVQSQYGEPGMPKIVVLGGADHHVYGVQNDILDMTQLRSSIDAALGISTGVSTVRTASMPLKVTPNPAGNNTTLLATMKEAGYLNIQIIDASGRLVRTENLKGLRGANKFPLNVADLATGTYTIKTTTNAETGAAMLVVR